MRVWFHTGHANKSLKHIGVVNHGLAGGHREWHSQFLAGHLRKVDCGERCVEVELQSPEVSLLTIGQPCKGLRIAEAELQLETYSIAVDYIFSTHGDIRTEVYLPPVGPALKRIPYCYFYVAFEALGVGSKAEESSVVYGDFLAPRGVKVGKIHLPVIQFRATPFSCRRLCCRVEQHGVVPQTADDIELLLYQRPDKCFLGEERICNNGFGDGKQPGYRQDRSATPSPSSSVLGA